MYQLRIVHEEDKRRRIDVGLCYVQEVQASVPLEPRQVLGRRLSHHSVEVARANAHPKCKQQGFASELFDFGLEPIEVKFAGASFVDCGTLIQVRGVDLLSFKPPAEPGSPFLLSGLLSDATGATTLRIVDNEWFAGDENWDVEVVGPLITIRRGVGDIALQVRVMPPHALVIERVDMQCEGVFIKGEGDILKFSGDGLNWNTLQSVSMSSCRIGIRIG